MSTRNMVHFEVDPLDLRRTRFLEEPLPTDESLAEGQALLEVESVAFTANNVTYAVFGEAMSYFAFFPAAPGWGRIPGWGIGKVVRSRAVAVVQGTRVYGYFPMSSHVVMTPKGGAGGFVDVAPHRAALPPIYNRYEAWSSDDPDFAARVSLLRPLFTTAFLLDDWLAEERWFGANRLLVTSASAKTAFSLAALVARRQQRPEIVGLTSPRHREFVASLGVYDRVAPYDDVPSLPEEATVSVDIAGSEQVLGAIHRRLRERLAYSCCVGASHWEQRGTLGATPDWPGPPPRFFFAPTRAQACLERWGPLEFQRQVSGSLERFLVDSHGGWLELARATEREAVERVYRQTVAGEVPPRIGNLLSVR